MSRKTESGKCGVVARHFGFRRNPVKKIRSKQQGFALLLFVTVLATAATTLTVKALNNNGNVQIDRNKITAAALAQAKEALIGYAITYADNHSGNVDGYLPCPDTSGTDIGGEGAAAGACGAQDVSAIGKLPWKTLKLPPLVGGDNECLWYAVSGTYKNNPPTGLMNWDTNGQLRVYAPDGTTLLTPADNQAVAVIFAPGIALGQSHTMALGTPSCGGNYTASNYLDNDTVHRINNANIAIGKFIQPHVDRDARGNILLTVNDQIVFITKQDIWNAMKKRRDFLDTLDGMTRSTAECIKKYATTNNMAANKSLPWPAQLALSDYTDNTRYNDARNLLVGRVPYKVNTSRTDTGNTIPGTPPSDYFLLKADNPSGTAYCSTSSTGLTWANIYPWWYNWKDHLFYGVSETYKPDNAATTACTSGHCVSVNGSGNYAAVVIFAGDRLAGQIRTDKSVVSAYLEGRNNTNIDSALSTGHENYQASSVPASPTFNDIVYCIKEDLSVVPGSAAGCL
ncbi:hypothetical protein [Gallionella capsiferriformans]|uniref:Uncharacterized protein n=1 Tax=Gallionella capsiferriformans (strain ES-2) TaxID=395494 RepID=D9SJD4_GALCS|nr:hypothetical protein [Gallionella capsiferriformans]ADL56322.1 hypothetical protein Galf_2319 [Gallionella capsiferriformans ES-2]